MRKGWIFIICLLMFALTGCNYDLDSSKQIQAVSPDEYVKTVANEFFSSENLDTLEIQKISQTISYLSKSYASYPSSVTGKPSIYLLIKDVQQIIGGDINVLPTLLNGFKNETGVYEANRDSGKWIRTAVATDSIVMHFKDQYNQDREGIMSWYYSYGQPMQLTLVRKSGTVKVEVPDRIMVKLRNLSSENDSALTINFRMIPDQTLVLFLDKGISWHAVVHALDFFMEPALHHSWHCEMLRLFADVLHSCGISKNERTESNANQQSNYQRKQRRSLCNGAQFHRLGIPCSTLCRHRPAVAPSVRPHVVHERLSRAEGTCAPE